jgi:hypothetical protein
MAVTLVCISTHSPESASATSCPPRFCAGCCTVVIAFEKYDDHIHSGVDYNCKQHLEWRNLAFTSRIISEVLAMTPCTGPALVWTRNPQRAVRTTQDGALQYPDHHTIKPRHALHTCDSSVRRATDSSASSGQALNQLMVQQLMRDGNWRQRARKASPTGLIARTRCRWSRARLMKVCHMLSRDSHSFCSTTQGLWKGAHNRKTRVGAPRVTPTI